MPDTVKDTLRAAQQNLADAARAIDAASVRIRTALANDGDDKNGGDNDGD